MNRAAQITELKPGSCESAPSSDLMMEDKVTLSGKRTRATLPAVVSPRPKIRARQSREFQDDDDQSFFLLSPLEAGFLPVGSKSQKSNASEHKVEYVGCSDARSTPDPFASAVIEDHSSSSSEEDEEEEELSMIHKEAASTRRKLPSLRPKPNSSFLQQLEEQLSLEIEDQFVFTPLQSRRSSSSGISCNDEESLWA